MNFSINIIDIINKNSGVVTVTEKPPYILETTTKNGGLTNEQIIYNIKGSTSSKGRIIIATIKIERLIATNTRAFFKMPSISSKYNIKLVPKSVKKDIITANTDYRNGEYIHTYLFDVLYNNTKSVSVQSNATGNLVYGDKPIPKRKRGYAGITGIDFGNKLIKENGCSREIRVFGKPGAQAKIRVVDDNDRDILGPPPFADYILKRNSRNHNLYGVMQDETGDGRLSREILIPPSGVYSFKVDFPSVVSKKTQVNGAFSSVNKIVLDDAFGIKAGDKVIKNTLQDGDETTGLTVVAVNPDGDNENELQLSTTVSYSDNDRLMFKRARAYKFYITTDDGLAPNIPRSWPTYTFKQFKNPILTVQVGSDAGRLNYEITHFNDVDIDPNLGAGQPHLSYFTGSPCLKVEDKSKTTSYKNVKTSIPFKYKLDLTGVHTFTSFTKPTNKDWLTTGDNTTQLRIHGVTSTLGGSPSGNTMDIEGVIDIDRW